MTTENPTANGAFADRFGMSVAGLCLIHCLLLPALAAVLPMLGVVAEAEWLHRLFVVMAIPVSLWAVVSRWSQKNGALFAVVIALGLGLLGSATVVEPLEVPLTVAGGVILFTAHAAWWAGHRS